MEDKAIEMLRSENRFFNAENKRLLSHIDRLEKQIKDLMIINQDLAHANQHLKFQLVELHDRTKK